jgi:Peptidase family M23
VDRVRRPYRRRVPPRPHPVVLATLAFACALVAFLIAPRAAWPSGSTPQASASRTRPGASATWRWPLRGPVVAGFRLTPRSPFARGQRRGIDIAAEPGTTVRAACPGRVSFAGPLPRNDLAIAVRCGSLVATYLRLGRLAVRAGARIARGEPLGRLGTSGRLRLGARRAIDGRDYLDPLALLRDPGRSAPPVLGRAPRRRRPRGAFRRRLAPYATGPQPRAFAPRANATRGSLPWPAYPALALVASALPVGGLVRRCRRVRQERVRRGWARGAALGRREAGWPPGAL